MKGMGVLRGWRKRGREGKEKCGKGEKGGCGE